MTKKFKSIKVGQRFEYGGVPFMKTPLKTIQGDELPMRVNALMLTPGCVAGADRYFFVGDDEVEV